MAVKAYQGQWSFMHFQIIASHVLNLGPRFATLGNIQKYTTRPQCFEYITSKHTRLTTQGAVRGLPGPCMESNTDSLASRAFSRDPKTLPGPLCWVWLTATDCEHHKVV